jgi:putative membrane protein
MMNVPQFVFVLLLSLAAGLYLFAAAASRRKGRRWPWFRTAYWLGGVTCAAAAAVGPLAKLAHTSFQAHMASHLLLGMLAPFLLIMAAPVTLTLRALNVPSARRLSHWLRSSSVRLFTHPVTASCLNIGGLWLLYPTRLFPAVHHNPLLHFCLHIHFLFAGCLYTAAFIYIDPTPHRIRFPHRAIVLLIGMAAHSILAKTVYAHPPAGVPASQAEAGAVLMYYGGDAIELLIIGMLCFQWYKAGTSRLLRFPRTKAANPV